MRTVISHHFILYLPPMLVFSECGGGGGNKKHRTYIGISKSVPQPMIIYELLPNQNNCYRFKLISNQSLTLRSYTDIHNLQSNQDRRAV